MPKVWAVSDSGHDFSKTAEFGQLEFVLPGKANVFCSDQLNKEICERLASADEGDYLVMAGTSLALCMCYVYFMKAFGKCNCLLFSFRTSSYELRTILDKDEA